MSTGGGAEVSLDRVTKTFTTARGDIPAVAGVTLDIAAGSFVSVIGPSGCGKTTLARMIGDLLEPTGGQILIDGQSPREARRDRRFGFVFQRPTLVDWRTVIGNVVLPLDVIGWSRRDKLKRGMELLELVGLDEFADHRPEELSGGMQQRVSIARALSFDPGVLLMDEPFGALDMMTRDRMGFELLRIWSESQKTVFFVTHSIEEAVLLSDVVVAMAPRPARVLEIVQIGLERPRTVDDREDPRFIAATRRLRKLLEP